MLKVLSTQTLSLSLSGPAGGGSEGLGGAEPPTGGATGGAGEAGEAGRAETLSRGAARTHTATMQSGKPTGMRPTQREREKRGLCILWVIATQKVCTDFKNPLKTWHDWAPLHAILNSMQVLDVLVLISRAILHDIFIFRFVCEQRKKRVEEKVRHSPAESTLFHYFKCILTSVPLKATSKLIHSTFCSFSPVSVCMCVQIQSLQVEHSEQEQRIGDYEEELTRAREELLQLQEETRQLEENVQSARAQLCPLEDAVKESHTHIAQVSELFICFWIISASIVPEVFFLIDGYTHYSLLFSSKKPCFTVILPELKKYLNF